MVLHRHNDITLQNDAVSVPQFIGTVIHATNVQRHLLLGNRNTTNLISPTCIRFRSKNLIEVLKRFPNGVTLCKLTIRFPDDSIRVRRSDGAVDKEIAHRWGQEASAMRRLSDKELEVVFKNGWKPSEYLSNK